MVLATLCMKDNVGNWIQGEREMVDYIRKGYSNLFTSSHCHAFRFAWNPPFWNNCLNEVEAENLIRPISNNDIIAGHYIGCFDGDWIWKASTIPKIKCFVWQCLHKSIPISTVLTARGMEVLPMCQLCKEGLESILHVLKDCHVARNLWTSLSPSMAEPIFFGLDSSEWLRQNCYNSKTSSNSDIRWGIIFSFGIWILWLNRNSVLFRHENGKRNLKYDVLAKVVEFSYIGLNASLTPTRRQIAISWQFPPPTWFKLNLNGSLLGNPGKVGGRGLIRNDKGEWLKGYARNVGFSTSVVTKLWALPDGLKLCIALKLPAVIIELDAKIIVDLLRKSNDHRNCIDALIKSEALCPQS
ncbi:hypothetical protein CMV_025317 [Castanea mollissima]|uniref:Reverse transcriptase zinc-binding domain-containing protein n=1 Tax=Castanea mollissima TaxID=60419 RepID=A0A8J4VBK3_9ROSI|nr:hypothetical protein CMV_025317 [Castanea mollissima]